MGKPGKGSAGKGKANDSTTKTNGSTTNTNGSTTNANGSPTTAQEERKDAPLRNRLLKAEMQAKELHVAEQQLRSELIAAEAELQQAQRRVKRAEDSLDGAQKVETARQDLAKGDLRELMDGIAAAEQRHRDHTRCEAAWKNELEALVMKQAALMAKRDEVKDVATHMEASARQDEIRALELEAKARKAEERCTRGRAKVDLLNREFDARRQGLAKHNGEARRLRSQVATVRKAADASALFWRRCALVMAAAAGIALLWRLTDPALW